MKNGWWHRIKEYVSHLDEGYADGETTKPPQKWNDLLIRLAREIEQVMRAEMFEPPGEPTYIPPEYIVFLSPVDDAALQGDKRIGFLKGLRNITAERARQIVDTGRTQTDKICVEFRVDSSLAEGQFYVKASWDVQSDPTIIQMPTSRPTLAPPDDETSVGIEEEATEVRRRPLYYLEVSCPNYSQPTSRPVFKPEVRIGRGGQTVPVDILLAEDREISRLHAILQKSAAGYEIVMRGRNPMFVNEVELQPGESAIVNPGEPIRMGTYTLRIIPDDS